MPPVRKILLLSTMFDKEIVENKRNENVLTSSIKAYKRHYPILAEYRLRTFKNVVKTERQDALVANMPPRAPQTVIHDSLEDTTRPDSSKDVLVFVVKRGSQQHPLMKLSKNVLEMSNILPSVISDTLPASDSTDSFYHRAGCISFSRLIQRRVVFGDFNWCNKYQVHCNIRRSWNGSSTEVVFCEHQNPLLLQALVSYLLRDLSTNVLWQK